jgi:hypothetical protein
MCWSLGIYRCWIPKLQYQFSENQAHTQFCSSTKLHLDSAKCRTITSPNPNPPNFWVVAALAWRRIEERSQFMGQHRQKLIFDAIGACSFGACSLLANQELFPFSCWLPLFNQVSRLASE